MISLVIRPKDEISRVNKMLVEEYGKASNIKSRITRLSVLSAITSTQQKLKLFSKVPPNGLVIFTGTVVTETNKEKMISRVLEPFRPIHTSSYLCDTKFHTEALAELLESDDRFGFIVIDGLGALFGTLCGSSREVVHRLSVDLPKKHGRGGQSALRFARLRLEKRHNYLRRVSELATQFFITNDRPNVTGIVLAGLADFKNELSASDMFDPRLQAVVLKIVDVSYGGDNGFNQAIELSAEELRNVKFVQEKKLIGQFMEEVSMDTMKYAFGFQDTMKALEMGAAHTLIVWENLEYTRFLLRNTQTGEEKPMFVQIKAGDGDTASVPDHMKDPVTGIDLEVAEAMPAVEWFAQNYKRFGTKLEFVSNRSQEGSQFCKGFGGIGALLRYQVDFLSLEGSTEDTDAPTEDLEHPV
jgi:peptide chain release factor subunit 1